MILGGDSVCGIALFRVPFFCVMWHETDRKCRMQNRVFLLFKCTCFVLTDMPLTIKIV